MQTNNTSYILNPQQKAAVMEKKPFPQQVNYPGIIKPNHVTQKILNNAVENYYNYWKKKYLKNDLVSLPGGYYVKGEITGDAEGFSPLGTSEGQGYGMIITVLMAGYDSNAQVTYNGLFKTVKSFKSSVNSNLMGWIITDSKEAQGHFPSATDGDLDIAYSLLLAHNQWGSEGLINYLREAQYMIEGIKESNITSNIRLNLGDWDSKSTFNTRSSDWMMSHFRAFYEFTGDPIWLNLINNLYSIYIQYINKYSQNTGLISDFIVKNPPQPAPKRFLNESNYTDAYNYNASRVPFRIIMDYAMYGEKRSKVISDKIVTWIQNKTNGNPTKIIDGYQLNGENIGNYPTAVFVSSFISAGVSNSNNQDWINKGWEWMKNKQESYFSDSYNLLNMLFITGNWWKPEIVK
ncbi:chitosanase [Bacillus cereus group sp. N17]|nr:chitosanase [Bacillus cereus group sp. N17]PEJ00662.1 chitosanase [Bacillus toyonensis]PFZ67563.1 chitosanase [Bacillus toyonensis]HDR3908612.1 chitosanase [Bacillus toyonensis]HDR7409220.1 chitosanase [Bacillus toyonensis]